MFTNLTNFEYTRNKKEAFGFYISYLFLLSLSGGLSVILTLNYEKK